jgi:hypothetical protein
MAQRGLPLLRAPGVDSSSNQPPAADPATGGGGGADSVTSSMDPATGSCGCMDLATGGCGGVDLATSSRGARDRARWATGLSGLFLFLEIIYGGGLLNSTTSVNSINRDGCLTPLASVNRLIEVVGPLRPD